MNKIFKFGYLFSLSMLSFNIYAALPNCMRIINQHSATLYDCGLGMKFREPSFDKCTLRDADIPSLTKWMNAHPQMQALDLGQFDLTAKGIQALANAQYVQWLNLTDDNVGLAGITAVAKMPALNYLTIRYGQITEEGAQVLAKNSHLIYLDIANNSIGPQGAMAIATIPTLKTIYLDEDNVGDTGIAALAANPSLINLYATENDVGPAGAAAIANQSHIVELALSDNPIGDQGAIALAANTTLRWLYVAYDNIGAAGIAALEANTNLILLSDMGNDAFSKMRANQPMTKTVSLHPNSADVVVKACEK